MQNNDLKVLDTQEYLQVYILAQEVLLRVRFALLQAQLDLLQQRALPQQEPLQQRVLPKQESLLQQALLLVSLHAQL